MPTHRRGRRVLVASLAGATLAASLSLASALPAAAHDELLGSAPATGDELATAPADVSLRFSDEVLPLGAAIVVADADGADWTASAVSLEGDTVRAELRSGMPDGRYEVRWRVVSSDGHPITGLVPFTVGDAPAASEPGGAPAAEPDAEAPDAVTPAPAQDESTDASGPEPGLDPTIRTLLLAAGGAGAALLLWLAVHLAGRKRTGATNELDERTKDDHE
ncbi:copper resistance CopC family protein [Agromyces soli]|uniref:Copper resistance protein CopC n=1 Tax=Agromyces soli TaxID=659012 RepID=A0ABY4AVG9_9MICO|nr:copper resistance CopC family protein [Agromyces soli]UOE27182.1 copper resistance protein CopC [Agromyces soli]